MYRKYERQYKRYVCFNMENEFTSDNPVKFWTSGKKLGTRPNNTIPMEIYDENDKIVCDVQAVGLLDKQSKCFQHIYNDGYSE